MSLKKKLLLTGLAMLIISAAVCGIYVSDYYRAGEDAAAVAADAAAEGYTCQHNKETVVFIPSDDAAARLEEPAGLVFYPGGKVEYTAYAPLMEQLAERGVLCVLVKMPANLAVLDMSAAEIHLDEFPDIERWYIGGHSLGGSMAASYAAEHAEDFEGLLLLASYSTADLTESGLDVLSIYGSEDGVLNLSKYDEYCRNLPIGKPGDADGTAGGTTEIIIEGGNHAGFGDYGPQEGDGEAALSGEEQQKMTVEAVMEILQGGVSSQETQGE